MKGTSFLALSPDCAFAEFDSLRAALPIQQAVPTPCGAVLSLVLRSPERAW